MYRSPHRPTSPVRAETVLRSPNSDTRCGCGCLVLAAPPLALGGLIAAQDGLGDVWALAFGGMGAALLLVAFVAVAFGIALVRVGERLELRIGLGPWRAKLGSIALGPDVIMKAGTAGAPSRGRVPFELSDGANRIAWELRQGGSVERTLTCLSRLAEETGGRLVRVRPDQIKARRLQMEHGPGGVTFSWPGSRIAFPHHGRFTLAFSAVFAPILLAGIADQCANVWDFVGASLASLAVGYGFGRIGGAVAIAAWDRALGELAVCRL